MDHPLIDLINAKIAKAEAEGAFDDLEGAGKPIAQRGNPENAVFDRILKENGAAPEAVTITKELARLRQELRDSADRDQRSRIIKELSLLETKLEIAKRG